MGEFADNTYLHIHVSGSLPAEITFQHHRGSKDEDETSSAISAANYDTLKAAAKNSFTQLDQVAVGILGSWWTSRSFPQKQRVQTVLNIA